MTVTLSKTDKGTLVVFEYAVGGFMRFDVPKIAKAVDGVMGQQLSGLAGLLGEVKVPGTPAPAQKPAAAGKGAEDAPAKKEGGADAAEGSGKTAVASVDQAFGDLKKGD